MENSADIRNVSGELQEKDGRPILKSFAGWRQKLPQLKLSGSPLLAVGVIVIGAAVMALLLPFVLMALLFGRKQIFVMRRTR
jgi:hypothetical protein